MRRSVVLAVARRPDLWLTGVILGIRLGRWRQWPPRVGPGSEYVRFRLITMYGDESGSISGPEAVAYLEWCRRMRRGAR